MEEKLAIKANAPDLLDRQLRLRSKKGEYGIIVLSSATDPYLHFEKETFLTRTLLEIILKHRFPVHLLTRSNLVSRDFDLLTQIDKAAILPADLTGRVSRGVFMTFSFSTLDDGVARIFEPGATPPSVRLNTMKTALTNGFKSGVSLMPLLPYISDKGDVLETMFRTFSGVGSHYIFPSTLTLFGTEPSDSKTLVMRAIKKHYPELETKYFKLFGANDYLPAYYQQAFSRKVLELSKKYNIKNTLLD